MQVYADNAATTKMSKAAIEAMKEAAAAVTFASTSAGTVTFTCLNEVPAVDISVIVEVSR